MYVSTYFKEKQGQRQTNRQTEREISNKTNREEKCFDFHIRYIRVKT